MNPDKKIKEDTLTQKLDVIELEDDLTAKIDLKEWDELEPLEIEETLEEKWKRIKEKREL
jgi:hypothetical protein